MTKGKCLSSKIGRMSHCLSFGFVSAAVLAESASPEKAQALTILRAGNTALSQGRAAEALAKFEEAYRLSLSPKIHYNLGQAHSLIPGHEARAYDEMARFLVSAKDADPKLRSAAEKQLKQLRPKVGLVIVLAEPADADLLVDDVDTGKISANYTTVLGIGTHGLALKKDSVVSAVQWVTVAGNESLEVKLQVPPPAPPPSLLPVTTAPVSIPDAEAKPSVSLVEAAPVSAPRHDWSWRRKVGAGLAGLSLASLVFGVVEHVSYFGKARDFRSAGCGTADLSVGPNCGNLNNQFNSARTWFLVGYLGAVVLGGTGSYLLCFAPPESGHDGRSAASVSSGLTIYYQGRF